MTDEAEVVIPFPERIDRRLRLGPFPSAPHALKFVAYAVVGGLLAVALGPIWWIPFLGAGLVVTVPPWAGPAPDRRCATYLRWRWRRATPLEPMLRAQPGEPSRPGGVSRLAPGRFAGIIVAGGVPTAFLPVEDRRQLFLEYRSALRALQGGAVVSVGVEPLSARPFLPRLLVGAGSDAEGPARQGYAEMVRLLCRRRFRRRVRWVIWSGGSATDFRRLDQRLGALTESLERMGVKSQRVVGPALEYAFRNLGWGPGTRR